MSCASCALSVEAGVKKIRGVSQVSVNYALQNARIDFNEKIITPYEIRRAVQAIGYDLAIDDSEIKPSWSKPKVIWAALFALPVVVLGMFFHHWHLAGWFSFFLTLPVLCIGKSFYVNALKKLKHGETNMDTLVSLSAGVSFLYSACNLFFTKNNQYYFEAAAVIIAFVLIGKWLEEKARANAASGIRKLMSDYPKQVTVLSPSGEKKVSLGEVNLGDIILVRPGEKIPVDGVVHQGVSSANESAVTGESIPAEKKRDDKVFAGTININGSLQVAAQKIGSETLLAQMAKLVEEAQATKPRMQRLTDKAAGVFVPVVIGISALTFILWLLIGGTEALPLAIQCSVAVLIIACPCALGLAAPTAIMVGFGMAAEQNILIRDAACLEAAEKINAVVVDKTGTLTLGTPGVTHYIKSEKENSEIFYSLELLSEHPAAVAVCDFFKKRAVEKTDMEDFKNREGKGIEGMNRGKKYFVGSYRFLKDNQVAVADSHAAILEQWIAEAKTVVCFFDEKEFLAAAAVEDQVKPSSKEGIRLLQKRNIEVYMLTGDSAPIANRIGQQVGIKNVYGNMLPQDKSDFIKKLQSQGKVTAMVGDGINDAQALALADVSIAMGKGSDVAMDVAQMTLISSNLIMISKAIDISQKIISGIRQNLFWAFIYNLVSIPVAAGILYPAYGFLLNPMIAAASMALSSICVAGNSLRLRRKNL